MMRSVHTHTHTRIHIHAYLYLPSQSRISSSTQCICIYIQICIIGSRFTWLSPRMHQYCNIVLFYSLTVYCERLKLPPCLFSESELVRFGHWFGHFRFKFWTPNSDSESELVRFGYWQTSLQNNLVNVCLVFWKRSQISYAFVLLYVCSHFQQVF
jgi:hypothetical protein